MIATVVRTKDKENRDKQDGDLVENVAVADEAHSPLPLIRVAKPTTILPKSEAVVLDRMEARELIQLDELLDWDFIQVLKIATGITNVFPKRIFYLLIMNTSKVSLILSNN